MDFYRNENENKQSVTFTDDIIKSFLVIIALSLSLIIV